MKNFKSLNDSEEFKSVYKIENLQNTDFAEKGAISKERHGLGFTDDTLINAQFTPMDLGEMTGLDVYNKTERK